VLQQELAQQVASLGGNLPAGVAHLVDQRRQQPRLLLRLCSQQVRDGLCGLLLDVVQVVSRGLLQGCDQQRVAPLETVLQVPEQQRALALCTVCGQGLREEGGGGGGQGLGCKGRGQCAGCRM
jgi:hypothetical protein